MATNVKQATGTAVAKMTPMAQFKTEIDRRREMFDNALPAHVPVEKFKANLIAAVSMTPKLLECHRGSLFQAAMTAAQLGLMVDPVLGHAYMVPYGNTVTMIPGYKGFIHLARQSGEIANLYAHEVYENDEFEMDLGTAKRLVHRPFLKGDRGKVIGVYAAWSYSKALDGHGNPATDFEFMTIADIEAIRQRSRSGNNGPWKTDFIQMARKTVIRRAAKYLPLSVQRAAVLDAAYDEGRTAHMEGDTVVVDGEAPIDITDEATSAPAAAKATAQVDSIEAKVTAGRRRAAPAVTVVRAVEVDGAPDWAGWSTRAAEAVAALPSFDAVTAWEAAHKEIIAEAEFTDPESAESVRAAIESRTADLAG